MNEYKRYRLVHEQEAAAAKAGMSVRTAMRVERATSLPSQRGPRAWRTRQDPLSAVQDSEVVPLLERDARRQLLQIHAATEFASLRIPPGNQLEALRADRKGQHSIRINDQWRICFVWKTDGAHRVEIVGYH
jgi:proteic killer suppression protein